MKQPRIHTIPPEQPFVDVLANGLLKQYGANPLTLSKALVLVPSRRAARSLQEALLRASNGKPLLLPQIRPVGDVDEEELSWTQGLDAKMVAELPPVISDSARLMRLAQLVMQFHQKGYDGFANIEQATYLALDLAALLDEVAREELSFDQLATLVPDNYVEHWQITLEFLKILTQHWPQIIAEAGAEEGMKRRIALLHMLAAEWERNPPSHPVIVAGTTGSIPATANLIRVASQLPQGMVILPGLDTLADAATWEVVDETHPQAGLKRLLAEMKLSRSDVTPYPFAVQNAANRERAEFLQLALLPPEKTDGWKTAQINWDKALKGLSVIECDDLEEEALVIALQMRAVLETPGKTVGLITHDRALARRVAAALRRYNVEIDDSAGMSLLATPPGVFLRLVAEVASSRLAPVPLLGLLKHPLAGAGMSVPAIRDAARLLEKEVLRGVRLAPGIEGLQTAVEHRKSRLNSDALRLVKCVSDAFAPLLDVMQQSSVPLSKLLKLHMEAAEKLAGTQEKKGHQHLWEGDAGEKLAEKMQELADSSSLLKQISPAYYPGLFTALLQPALYRPRFGKHPRVHILSPIEARLQHFDRVILGGLNEGSWPQEPLADPWMSRPMRSQFGLPAPERRIGQSAHDFLMLACAQEAVLTRALKADGKPTVASRWLQRIEALLASAPEPLRKALVDTSWKHWVQRLHRPATQITLEPPLPVPPLEARPRDLSVTKIERLLRDPYGVYAEKILRLRKLDPLDDEPDAAEFGTVIHNALELFAKAHPDSLPEDALEQLIACGREAFRELLDRPAVHAFWWPRYERVAAWIVEREKERRPELERVIAEREGEWYITPKDIPFRLHTRIDRIEQDPQGGLRIIDYKTGGVPTKRDRESGLACQLPLEALILQQGTELNGEVIDLEYWRLRGGEEAGIEESLLSSRSTLTIPQLMERVRAGVEKLVALYEDPSTPYPACPRSSAAPAYNDYEHLERLAEWRR